ncbi:MAG TPA: undecaprenyldiphospho-muramoylpentapeptide beta-N-acetylglucosaminyltransferase [Coriobacteriia bacterium]
MSGGGTAGHIYPSLTVAAQLRDEERSDIAYVGTPEGLEARLATEAGIDFFAVDAKGFDRADVRTLLSAGWTTARSFFRCLGLLRAWRPDVVIGFGGYVSLPLGLATAFSGIPLVLHEQNAVPGLANRVLSRWAGAVCVTYPVSIDRLAHPRRAVVTGNPVRGELASVDRVAGRRALGLKAGDVVLLAFGGSRGARHLNEALLALYGTLSAVKGLRVVHVAGPLEADAVRARLAELSRDGDASWWTVHDYIPAMGDAIAAADLVVCRAGATTLAELATVGRASVLVPYPYATDDHQTRNAQALLDAGAASLVADSELDTPAFGQQLGRLLRSKALRAKMAEAALALSRPYAAQAVADVALEQALRKRAGK